MTKASKLLTNMNLPVILLVCLPLLVNRLKARAQPRPGSDGACNTLSVKDGCLCIGSTIVYECAVDGSVEGLTVWEATGCSQDIILHHSNFIDESGPGCPNVHGRGISINDSCYVSTMTIVNVSESNIGGSVTCSLDVGSLPNIIGRRGLSIPSGASLIISNLREIDNPPGGLSFTWDPLFIADCPSLHYMIKATEGCGSCPMSVSDNTATCSNVRRGKMCTLSVFVNLCSDQIRSDVNTVSTGSLPMFTNLRSRMEESSDELTLIITWSLMNATYCPSPDYMINAAEGCGTCSVSEQENSARCQDVKRGSTCTYVILVNVCGEQIRREVNISLSTGSSDLPVTTIIGIVVGVTGAAVPAMITVVVIVVFICYIKVRGKNNPSQHHDGGEVNLHNITTCDTNPESSTGNERTDNEEQGNDDSTPIRHDSRPQGLQLRHGSVTGSCDSPGTFAKYSQNPPQLAIGDAGSLKQAVIGEATKITVLLNDNRQEPAVLGKLLMNRSDSESICIQCKVTEIELNKKYELEYTPTTRGQHLLHIKIDGEHIEGSPYSVIVKLPVHMLGTAKHVRTIGGVNQPSSLAINQQGEILVVEGGRQCVSILRPDGTNIRTFGSPAADLSPGSQILKKPHGVAVCDDGTILVVDSGKHCVAVFTPEGKFTRSVGTFGSGPLQFDEPMGIGIHPITKHIFITEYRNHRIQVLSSDLEFVTCYGSEGSDHGQFIRPWDVSFISCGDVYIADSGNHRIQVFKYHCMDKKFVFLNVFGEEGRDEGQLNWPSSICVDSENRVYVTEDHNYRVSIFSHVGKFLKSFGKKGKSLGKFDLPHGIVIDNKSGDIYISDHKNNRLQVF